MSISNAHIPKLGVVDVINFPHFSNQSLAVEPLIVFPIRLQIGSSWTLKVVPAGSSPLAVVNLTEAFDFRQVEAETTCER